MNKHELKHLCEHRDWIEQGLKEGWLEEIDGFVYASTDLIDLNEIKQQLSNCKAVVG